MLQAGAGKAELNLDGVLPHDGFEAVHDALYLRSLVLDGPSGRACLLLVECTSLRDDALVRAAAAEAAGVAEDAVWVAVTHTFSAPHVRTPEHLPDDAARARNELLATRLAEAARGAVAQAAASLEPARFATGRNRSSVNVNRDVETPDGWWLGSDPDGFSDRTVRVLTVTSAADPACTIATLFCADVQSSVVQGVRDAEGRLLVSGDLAGEAARILEDELGGVAFFLTGAAGDQAPRVKGAGALPELGSILAAEVASAVRRAEAIRANNVQLSAHAISLPGQRRADFASLAPTRSYTFEPADPEPTTVYLARIGALTVAGIQPEVESVFGARLRDTAPAPFELVTLVNGAQKYLPGALSYDRITYEAMNSGFARGAAEQLEDVIITLVKENPA